MDPKAGYFASACINEFKENFPFVAVVALANPRTREIELGVRGFKTYEEAKEATMKIFDEEAAYANKRGDIFKMKIKEKVDGAGTEPAGPNRETARGDRPTRAPLPESPDSSKRNDSPGSSPVCDCGDPWCD